jgi:hypothetical protein
MYILYIRFIIFLYFHNLSEKYFRCYELGPDFHYLVWHWKCLRFFLNFVYKDKLPDASWRDTGSNYGKKLTLINLKIIVRHNTHQVILYMYGCRYCNSIHVRIAITYIVHIMILYMYEYVLYSDPIHMYKVLYSLQSMFVLCLTLHISNTCFYVKVTKTVA